MGGIFARFRLSSGDPIRICMLGLDSAGKTTVLNKLKLSKTTHTLPTIGFNVETVTPFRGLTMTIWDVGGQDKLRTLWKHYYRSTEGMDLGLIFVVDSADRSRFVEAAGELTGILNDVDMSKVPLVVLANKQDLPEAASVQELEGILQLHDRPEEQRWHVQECCAIKGVGIYAAMGKLSRFIKEQRKYPVSNSGVASFGTKS